MKTRLLLSMCLLAVSALLQAQDKTNIIVQQSQSIIISQQKNEPFYIVERCYECDCFNKKPSDYDYLPEPIRTNYKNVVAYYCQQSKILNDAWFNHTSIGIAGNPQHNMREEMRSQMLVQKTNELNQWFLAQNQILLKQVEQYAIDAVGGSTGASSSSSSSGYSGSSGTGSSNYGYNSSSSGSNYSSSSSGSSYSSGTAVSRERQMTERFERSNSAMDLCLAGIFYLNGTNGVAKDESKGMRLIRKSADMGYVDGQRRIAEIYYKQKNYADAFKYMKMAAEGGNASAQNNFGAYYHNGTGTQKDLNKALYWYEKAVAKGDAMAKDNLKKICYDLANDYLAKDGSANSLKALEYYQKVVDLLGDSHAKNRIDNMYHRIGAEYEREENYPKALEYYQKAARMGYPVSSETLTRVQQAMNEAAAEELIDKADAYKEQKNYPKAIEYYEKAAAAGDAGGYWSIGFIYENHLKNYPKAAEYYEKATVAGDTDAYKNLGYIYANDEMLNDYHKAIYWYEKAVNVGSSVLTLANLYRIGDEDDNIAPDYDKAIKYFLLYVDHLLELKRENRPALKRNVSTNTDEDVTNDYIGIAYNDIADCYNKKGNTQQAMTYHQKAADLGNTYSQRVLEAMKRRPNKQ